MGDEAPSGSRAVDLTGDAYLTFTAPFYRTDDPLVPRSACVLPAGEDLDGTRTFVRSEVSFASLFNGSLTYGEKPTVGLLTTFAGGNAWRDAVTRRLEHELARYSDSLKIASVDAIGALCPDGYGAVAVTLRIAGGWAVECRKDLLAAFGPDGRDQLGHALRSTLLPPIERMLRRCGATDTGGTLPYFNLTFCGETDHPEPGRSTLDDQLRALLYPDSPLPLTSRSPWRNQFLYAGYAFNLLATTDPGPSLSKFSLLLLILDVAYARLARTAAAADESLRHGALASDVGWLENLEYRLRSDYHYLVTPTFSFDHHTLMLRDAILQAWGTDRLQSRADSLLSAVRQVIESRLAEEQAHRVGRVKTVVTALTILSAIATVEAMFSLFEHIFS
ncbi:hypothetical protein [Solwaraspora sp. WMMD792]|uniref:hypothetical protein n=1 Tax=Solwaraspora sp. WMMD792 TaxID=3016099 RepID=UPI002417950A|nr:hypothetical protein [Solwaraspora sp. WMMD792]MDG4774898.1 hypothetical protein [Solwaraspora sp. WMMD792]